MINASVGMEIFDDCWYHSNDKNYAGGVDGVFGASGSLASGTSDQGHPGTLLLSTGTNTAGGAALLAADTSGMYLYNPGASYLFEANFFLSGLSASGQRYTAYSGWGVAAGGGAYAIMFRYTDNVNSGKWQAVVRSASSDLYAIDTGITPSAATYAKYAIAINAAGDVEWFIDEVSVASQASVVGAYPVSLLPASIQKSSGGTARAIQLDYYHYTMEFDDDWTR